MNKNSFSISIIIIGYNTEKSLYSLLQSIEGLSNIKNIKEILYVDDGSSDQSVAVFNKHNLPFSKTLIQFSQNKGRACARQSGANKAKSDWFLFLNSNVEINPSLVYAYMRCIQKSSGLAYAGLVNYFSSDLKFQNYLNHSGRGIRQFKEGLCIPYNYLLFSNCMICSDVFKQVFFNLQLKHYGGEELDFSYKLSLKYPSQIIAAPGAIVNRKRVPPFKLYCEKLIEFGNKNFFFLNLQLQKKVIKFAFLLNKNIVFSFSAKIILATCFVVYPFTPSCLRFYILRLGMLCSILSGYYKSR